MRPAKFNYHRPTSVTEAVQLFAQTDGAKALAGGHSLIPAMNLRLSQPDALVDIGRIEELHGIRVEGSSLIISALTTHAQIAASKDVQKHCAALAEACGNVGDAQVRNWGTLGGNIAHADPASDPPTVLVACNAIIHIQGTGGSRSVGAEAFFVDVFTTDLQPGELITAVEIPSLADWQTGYIKMPHPASRYAVVGVAVALHMAGGKCDQARVALGGVTAKATCATHAEKALIGSTLDAAALDAAAKAIMVDVGDHPMSDIYADGEYRRAMAGVYLKRAIKAAM
ncbi:MAG: FAD binding domain-containing protein [Aggregatilineales bacterium]